MRLTAKTQFIEENPDVRGTTRIHRLPNGITLLGQDNPLAQAAALSVLVPAGAVNEPQTELGISGVLVEMFNKGAGEYSSRELSARFEDLGASRSSSAGVEVSVFSCAALAANLETIIRLQGMVLQQATLPENELESVRQLALQELKSLDDEPASKVMVELAEQFYPPPFGRSSMGTISGLNNISPTSLRHYYQTAFVPEGTIIGVSGKFDWERVIKVVEDTFGGWRGGREKVPLPVMVPREKVHHLHSDSAQVQIALGYPSVSLGDPHFYTARVAVGLLSGGMSGRLFIEVREKRGLVYRVSASHNGARGRGAIFAYAGTTPENAKETLAVTVAELRKLAQGAAVDEIDRAKADLKSRLIMQSESTSAQASHLVTDWWNLGRVRTLEEIKENIDRVDNDGLREHLAQFPAEPLTLVTLGPVALEIPR